MASTGILESSRMVLAFREMVREFPELQAEMAELDAQVAMSQRQNEDFEQYFNATIAAIERRTIGSHEMIQDLWDQRDRKSRFLDFQHDMEMYRQETQYHRETITSCRELVVGIQEAMEGYTRQLDEILDNGDSSADDTKAILDLAAAKDSAVQNLVRMNDHIASEEAKLVKMRGEVPIIPEDWDELVAEFDPQPMRLIESGMGEKVFPIALRFQELDE